MPRIIKHVESLQIEFGIQSVGVGMTSMEDVFIRVGELSEDRRYEALGLQNTETQHHVDVKSWLTACLLQNLQDLNSELKGTKTKTGFMLFWLHVYAIIRKRWAYFYYHPIGFVITVVLLFFVLTVYLVQLNVNCKSLNLLKILMMIQNSSGKTFTSAQNPDTTS